MPVLYNVVLLLPRTFLSSLYMVFQYLFIEWVHNTFPLKEVSGKTEKIFSGSIQASNNSRLKGSPFNLTPNFFS